MQDKDKFTRAQIAAAVPEWIAFSSLGTDGEYAKTTDGGGPVWITRVPSEAREDGYAYTIFDAAAWGAFSATLTYASFRELLRA
ncbi:hypothetical protein AB0878_44765 [Amycolatopsis sp. NPDC047767]|uniref:hypothetical protein n=1 Tax=Amycolatopsis sp. NPDC047767 TaxID=3156765 RepID=UPI0034555D15